MKTIKLKQLSLLNFKGIRQMTVDFSDHTVISGRNASGKSTIFDAFVWVLFGKNAADAKQFGIKTYDREGNVIPRLPHEVTAILDVDGEEITLTRSYVEKWVTKRGTAEETMTGHEEQLKWNDVPVSLKEWGEKINELCPEATFKYITNPLYFVSQKKDVQRAMLVKMAGDISNESVATSNVFFADLLNKIKGKTLEEYKKELAAKKTRIKKEVDELPARIDERRRDAVEPEDWTALEKELSEKQTTLSTIGCQLTDESKRQSEKAKAKLDIQRQDADLNFKMQDRINQIRIDTQKDHFEKVSQKQQTEADIKDYQNKISAIENNIKAYNSQMDKAKAERETLLSEYNAINAEALTLNDTDFICPTCKRQLEVDDIEAKQASMREEWENQKAKRIEANISKGKAIKAGMTEIQGRIDNAVLLKATLTEKLQSLQASEILAYNGTAPDFQPIIENDAELKRINAEIAEVRKRLADLENQTESEQSQELKEAKAVIAEAIAELQKRINKRDTIEQNEKRIADLENQLKAAAQELSKIEGEEQTVFDFTKAKMTAVTNRINGMFELVKFRLYETQINGGEREVCEILVDGVPYSDANNAARINAGLDIIRTICRHTGITAPIVIDNAESVNNILKTDSQQIELVVTKEPLKITNN